MLYNILKNPKIILFASLIIYILIMHLNNYNLNNKNKKLIDENIILNNNLEKLTKNFELMSETKNIIETEYKSEINKLKNILSLKNKQINKTSSKIPLKNCYYIIQFDEKTELLK